MKLFSALLAAVALIACAGFALADETGSATAGVYVTVNPNISILPLEANVNMGTIQTGSFTGTIPWRVDANTQNVRFFAAASYLYKGDDPNNPAVPPILLNVPYGIVFTIAHGGPVGGADDVLTYQGGTDINGFPGLETITKEYESSDPGHMSQDVQMVVKWDQPDNEKPMGEYSGQVRLSGLVVLF